MIRTDWGIERLLKEFYGSNVIKSVHVEGDSRAADPVEETAWLQSLADSYGFPHAIVVFCDLQREDAEAQLARHVEFKNTRGVRIREHPDDADARVFRKAYAALEKYNLSYELNASPGKLVSGRGAVLSHLVLELRFLRSAASRSGSDRPRRSTTFPWRSRPARSTRFSERTGPVSRRSSRS